MVHAADYNTGIWKYSKSPENFTSNIDQSKIQLMFTTLIFQINLKKKKSQQFFLKQKIWTQVLNSCRCVT